MFISSISEVTTAAMTWCGEEAGKTAKNVVLEITIYMSSFPEYYQLGERYIIRTLLRWENFTGTVNKVTVAYLCSNQMLQKVLYYMLIYLRICIVNVQLKFSERQMGKKGPTRDWTNTEATSTAAMPVGWIQTEYLPINCLPTQTRDLNESGRQC